jgi:FkbM family methyltransferase
VDRVLPDVGTSLGDRLGRNGLLVRALRPAYARWLRAAYGRRGLPWHINGEPIRIDPDARHLVPQENERPLFEYLRQHISPGDVVLDIGAFIGTYAILEARWAGARGRVLAFEPSPSSFAILERQARMNGLGPPRFDAYCVAVGARREQRGLTTFDEEPYRNMIAADGAAAVMVDVVTVDSACAALDTPPTWIRMDVQGLEFEVLRGARELLRERRGRLQIVAEMHPQHWPVYGIDPRDAAERLAELGLRARNVVPDQDPFGYDAHAILEPIE